MIFYAFFEKYSIFEMSYIFQKNWNSCINSTWCQKFAKPFLYQIKLVCIHGKIFIESDQ